MAIRPFRRDALFAFLCLLTLAPFLYLSLRTVRNVHVQTRPGKRPAILLLVSGTLIFATVSVLTPVLSLRRLYRRRIHVEGQKPCWLKLFSLHLGWHCGYDKSALRVSNVIENSLRYAEGEQVEWNDVERLGVEDREYIRQVVESSISLKKQDDDGQVLLVESSAWLLVFYHLVLASLILLAGIFAAFEIRRDNLTEDQIGKSIAEWMSNYVLLIVAILQVVTRGAWFRSFAGTCFGPIATMNFEQRNALVALYIAMAPSRIVGLRREHCYSKVRMNGWSWNAPPTNTLLLASLGELFSMYFHDDKWCVNWYKSDDICTVRTVGL